MLQVARLAPRLLTESTSLVLAFLAGQLHPDGGFQDRAGQPDLYYTVFGLEGHVALQAPVPHSRVIPFLDRFGDGASLDFVHLACLARCWASMPAGALDDDRRARLAERVGTFRSADGGFDPDPQSPVGSAYGAFVGLGAFQDLKVPLPDPDGLVGSLEGLVAADGGLSNVPAAREGLTTATAAGVTLLRQLDQSPWPSLGDWLLARAHPQGGFLAFPGAPMPDLLSTATAIHALVGMHVSIEALKDPCLDFIDSLWTNQGGFYGYWADEVVDCEYTYYGLLSLGHLSL